MMNKLFATSTILLLLSIQAFSQPYAFTVRIENVSDGTTLQPSDGSMQSVPLAPGVWALHSMDSPLFTVGQADRGQGLEALAEDGSPGTLGSALNGQADISRSAVFNTPEGAAGPGALLPGAAYVFSFNAEPGARLSFATMFIPSNDLFYGPDAGGIHLFDAAGQPISGDFTSMLMLWDAGTEANEEPGVGPNQAQRQSGPDAGPADPDNTVRLVNDSFTYPDVDDVLKVTITAVATTPFIVRIENVSTFSTLQPSDGSMQPVPLSPGVWAVHNAPTPFFNTGFPDRGDGLEAIAEDGSPGSLAGNLFGQAGILSSDLFNTPDGAAGPAPVLPGDAYQFIIYAAPGSYFSLATMFVPSNDLVLAPDESGISLFDSNGKPVSGNVTTHLDLWDVGSEANEEPGVGPNQVQRQSGPNTGPADPDDKVRLVNDGFTYPDVNNVIRLTINPMLPVAFTVRIENVSTDSTLMPSDGSQQPVPMSPGVWSVHNSFGPLFRSGAPDRGDGLEAIAEDGNPSILAGALAGQSGIFDSDLFNTPVGAAGPGPLLPGHAYEFSFEANPGSYISLATMFVPSNDLIFAPDETGIPLFDQNGEPKNNADVTRYVLLWDAGTEENEEPGLGPNQVQRQPGPNTGPADSNNLVRLVDDGFTYPEVVNVIRVIINPSPPAEEATFTFGEAPGADFSGVTYDAYIDGHKDDFNTGETTFLRVGNDGILKSGHRPNRSLLKFDFVDGLKSVGVTEPAQIVEAWIELRVFSSEGADDEGITVDVFDLLKEWNEGNTDYASAAKGEVTWNAAMRGKEKWSIPGAADAGIDRAADAVATQIIDATGRVRFDVLSSVRNIFNNGNNYGWLFEDRNESKDKYYRIYSSEHRKSARRPKLIVVADLPPGSLTKSSKQTQTFAQVESGIPQAFQLEQNYPNPFNPETLIRYTMLEAGDVSLTIYNSLGQRIRKLVNSYQRAGQHQITWRGGDDKGLPVATGIYFYRLEANGFVSIRKMSLLK